MGKQQTVGNIRIGFREHSSGSLHYTQSSLIRRLKQVTHLYDWWPGGWSPEPDMVCVIPTYRCNLRCPFCFQRDEQGNVRVEMHHKELSPDEWLPIIDQIAQLTSTIFWMGGEIMIYPQIIDLLAYCKSKGLKVIMVTNGFHLTENVARLMDIGIDAVTVSLDGFEAVHNKARRNPRSFSCAVEGLRELVAARNGRPLPILTINHVITQENYRDISDFLDFARELGADMVQFIGLMYYSTAVAQRHHAVLHQEFGVETAYLETMNNGCGSAGIDAAWLQQEVNRLVETSPALPVLRFCSIGLDKNIEAHYGPDEGLPVKKQRCTAVYRRMLIQPNGEVALCYNQPEIIMGDAGELDLASIWNGEKFCQARQRIRRELLPGCIRCGWLDYE